MFQPGTLRGRRMTGPEKKGRRDAMHRKGKTEERRPLTEREGAQAISSRRLSGYCRFACEVRRLLDSIALKKSTKIPCCLLPV